MKYLALLFAMLALAMNAQAQDEEFLYALSDAKPICNSSTWQVEKNEIYQFVRFMGRREYGQIAEQAPQEGKYLGDHPDVAHLKYQKFVDDVTGAAHSDPKEPNDRTYAVVKMGHVVVIAPVQLFSSVPPEKLQRAATVYDRQIQELSDSESAIAAQRAQQQQKEQLDTIQGQLDQVHRQQQLNWLNGRR